MRPRSLIQARAIAIGLTGALALGACGKPSSFAAPGPQAEADTPDPGYRAPPQLLGWTSTADGSVSLSGRAHASWTVRLASPLGVQDTTADGAGNWIKPLGPVSEPALYRLAEEDPQGRRVDAEGLIAVLPGPPVVALLRAGSGAEVQDRGRGGLELLALDYDSGGGAVVSGRAGASATVRVLVDGLPAGEGAAGPDGRFSLTLTKPLASGPHRLQVQSARAAAEAAVQVSPPQASKDLPYQIQAEPSGWRVDWVTAGGGPQTTVLLGG